MTFLPLPDPAVIVTDEIVDAAIAARLEAADHVPVDVSVEDAVRWMTRQGLEAVALSIVAAWQHWEEDQLP